MPLPPEALSEALARYGIDPAGVEPIGSFDNDLYRVAGAGTDAILRLSGGRSTEQIRGEIAWIEHLAAGGVPCARALPSPGGERVEPLDLPTGGSATAVLFERAPGRHTVDDDITAAFVRAWGATLGRIHALSRDYRPDDPSWTRPDWREDAVAMETHFPISEVRALARFREVVARLEALPRPPEAFGPIHGDAHRGNFFLHRGGPFLFDFYDCIRSWFVADIAIALFYAVTDAPDPERRDSWAAWFLEQMLAGYRGEHDLAPRWLAVVPDLLKLREIDTYALVLHNLGDRYHDHPWDARFMVDRKERIEAGAPYLEVDWEALG